MKNMMNWLMEEESGQGMVEYALILGLISIIAIAAITAVGGKVNTIWEKANSELNK